MISPFAESSHLIDMGAGVGKAMWHAGVAACCVSAPDGVESNPGLVKLAQWIADQVIRKAPEGAVWKHWSSKQVSFQTSSGNASFKLIRCMFPTKRNR